MPMLCAYGIPLIVAAGGGDFERPLGALLAFNV
jgi:hypothetical protein